MKGTAEIWLLIEHVSVLLSQQLSLDGQFYRTWMLVRGLSLNHFQNASRVSRSLKLACSLGMWKNKWSLSWVKMKIRWFNNKLFQPLLVKSASFKMSTTVTGIFHLINVADIQIKQLDMLHSSASLLSLAPARLSRFVLGYIMPPSRQGDI